MNIHIKVQIKVINQENLRSFSVVTNIICIGEGGGGCCTMNYG